MSPRRAAGPSRTSPARDAIGDRRQRDRAALRSGAAVVGGRRRAEVVLASAVAVDAAARPRVARAAAATRDATSAIARPSTARATTIARRTEPQSCAAVSAQRVLERATGAVAIDVVKYVVLVPDGCADEPLAELDGRTPLEAAAMPHLARARGARRGRAAPR